MRFISLTTPTSGFLKPARNVKWKTKILFIISSTHFRKSKISSQIYGRRELSSHHHRWSDSSNDVFCVNVFYLRNEMDLVDDAEAAEIPYKWKISSHTNYPDQTVWNRKSGREPNAIAKHIKHMENIFYSYIWWPAVWRCNEMPPQNQNNLDTIERRWE